MNKNKKNKASYTISGMHCASCAINLEKALKKNSDIKSASVNFGTKLASVEFEDKKANESEVRKIVEQAGFKIADDKKESLDNKKELQKLFWKMIVAIVLTLPIFIRMFWMWKIETEIFGLEITHWINLILAGIVVFGLGWQFHVGMLKQLKKFQANMDTLISVGTLFAYFYSLYAVFNGKHDYFEASATITTLILVGRYLELKTKGRASDAMQKLLELGVKKAHLVSGAEMVDTVVDKLKIGDVVLVKPSEKIPIDGVVVDGDSHIDESMLTGESMPISKKIGDQVFGATINQNGTLKIKVTKIGEDTILSQIIKVVEKAQSYKAPIQKLADKIAGIFVPVVLGIALLTFAGWMIYSGDVGKSIITAVAVVVISCPCALGIATPIAIMVGSGSASKRGVLIKDGETFEKVKDIGTIVFDKTGTLTKGEVEVKDIIPLASLDPKENVRMLRVFSDLESLSEHPLAKAISRGLVKKDMNTRIEFKSFAEKPGLGVVGEINGDMYCVGNDKLMKKQGILLSEQDQIKKQDLEHSGKTVGVCGRNNKALFLVSLEDSIKKNSKKVVDKAEEMGLKTVMLTGDNARTAKAISKELGIDQVFAEVLPAQKSETIKKLQQNNEKVIFAGDGINDAPALVQSDLGIAMGGGTDIAKEAGNIILMQDDPMKIIEAIEISQKTYRVIKQNLFWAFFYNALAIPLAVFGIVNPMIAALAMGFSDVTVVGNALRLRK